MSKIGKPILPVARVILQRTLVRGTQCPNQPSTTQHHHRPNQDSTSDVDLSQTNHRTERLKQKYDYSGRLIYTYGESFAFTTVFRKIEYVLLFSKTKHRHLNVD